jgi:hypothetical protein
MTHTLGKILACIVTLSFLVLVPSSYARERTLTPVDIQKLSRYDENRVLYQQFEKTHDEFAGENFDNSIAALMVIKDKKVYLIEDGYDSPEVVANNKAVLERGNQFLPDLWQNKISNSPNYVMITDRRIEIQKNTTKEFVSNNYKDFYLAVRDKLLKKHVAIFLSLVVNRKEAEISVSRVRIPRKVADGDQVKYITRVTGRTPDGGTVYYAEDANADGITETFTVESNDGFQWGFKSGPNIVCIINNTQKDIEKIIGRITNLAYFGSPEEEQIIKKTFPTPDKINSMIDNIYNIDAETERFLKKNNINLEDAVDKSSKSETKSETK